VLYLTGRAANVEYLKPTRLILRIYRMTLFSNLRPFVLAFMC